MRIARSDKVVPLRVPAGGSVRTPPRKWDHIDSDYLEKFDWDTLAFDYFVVGNRCYAICPPVRNLGKTLRSQLDNLGLEIQSRVKVKNFDRSCVATFGIDTSRTSNDTNWPGDENYLFDGQRVLLTLSKDNSIDWIRDWIAFHVRFHGIQGVLIYDNGSAYGIPALLDGLSDIQGLDSLVVVDWSFKYGPQGGQGRAWDSDFCQAGALNHARLKYLSRSSGVLSIDVDELLVSEARESIFDSLESAGSAFASFPGSWISSFSNNSAGLPESSGGIRRHFSFVFRENASEACPPKWAAIPSRLSRRSYYSTHSVRRANAVSLQGFSYRHFKAINTGWKYNRLDSAESPNDLQRDDILASHFDLLWPRAER